MPSFSWLPNFNIESLTFGADGALYGTTHISPTSREKCKLIWINPHTYEFADLGELDFATNCLASENSKPSKIAAK